MKSRCTFLAFAISLGCSGGTDSVNTPESPTPDAAADIEVIWRADDIAPDTLDAGPELPSDLPPDLASGCEAGEGCFRDPCGGNEDCLSGLCVEHMGDSVCTRTCAEDCPPGWSCKGIDALGPDVYFLCISNYANLCRPCATGDNCKSVGAEDVCLDYGDEGSFCGGPCETNDDCPWGFSCEDGVTVDGIETRQCTANAGVCPCTDSSVALALWTPCDQENEWGVCDGKRVCMAEGLTTCDAEDPAEESCNGVDDDCDGETDEDGCDDDNPCTEDSCKGEAGCEFVALDGGECLDGDACTMGDHCDAGDCVGTPILCQDDNPCTDDQCDGEGGCEFVPNTADCDDGDPCTVADQCSAGTCQGFPMDCDCATDEDCLEMEDGDLCNGTLLCDTSKLPYTCAVDSETPIACDEPTGVDAPCQEAICDPLTGDCSVVPAHEGVACNDGDACTIGEACGDGVCSGGVALNCTDENLCTDNGCDPDSGCWTSLNQAPCYDGDPCTTNDHCAGGECAGGPALICDDDNLCTDDTCSPDSGCVFTINSAPCDDGDVCTSNDQCVLGACQGGALQGCDDEDPCTMDLCASGIGCVHTLNTAPCDDEDACTLDDTCADGVCTGIPANCDDDNPCTDNGCDPDTGCWTSLNQAPCSDGIDCSVGDLCAEGQCAAGAPTDLLCGDDNPCTDDVCDVEVGCQHPANDADCPQGHCWETGCVSNWALDLDSDSDRVLLPKNIVNPYANWTIEAWIHPRYSGERQKFVYGEANLEFRLNNDDTLSIHIHSSGSWHSLYLDDPLELNTWHHVVASLSASQGMFLFVDGEQAGTLSWTGKQGTTASQQGIIGHKTAGSSGRWFDGYIDAVRISKVVRYTGPFEPPTSFTPDANTLGLWSFDDYGDINAVDSSPAGITGDIQNCTWVPATYLP